MLKQQILLLFLGIQELCISVCIHSEVQRPKSFTYIHLGACKLDQQHRLQLPQQFWRLLLQPDTIGPVTMCQVRWYFTDQPLCTFVLLPFWMEVPFLNPSQEQLILTLLHAEFKCCFKATTRTTRTVQPKPNHMQLKQNPNTQGKRNNVCIQRGQLVKYHPNRFSIVPSYLYTGGSTWRNKETLRFGVWVKHIFIGP